MSDRLAITDGALVLMRAIVNDPDAQGLSIEEPTRGPVQVGVLRRSTLRVAWSHGPDLEGALRLAIGELRHRPGEENHG